jgi:glyoxylase-like metal-dependent hydrolase (beta-lactamase superfamily II)
MSTLQVADKWFQTRRIDGDLTLIWEPHVDPLLRCNIWHLRGRDKDLLVDTGLGVTPLRPAIEHLIDKPLTAVATHVHRDHVGGLHEFDERLIHQLEAAEMADYGTVSLHVKDCSAGVQAYFAERRDIGPDDILVNAAPHANWQIDDFAIQSAVPTAELRGGEMIDLGDRVFEVMHLPGHSVGSIGLWEAATGMLFSGDTIYDGPLLDELDGCSIPDYVVTMKRLRYLPVTVVHAGHDPSFGRARMIEICDAYLDLRA